MIVVADTSPLNYLIRLGSAGILPILYDRIAVPPAVLMEMRHPEAPPEVRAWASAPPKWVQVLPVRLAGDTLLEELGAGEREAISLALEREADLLLIDDWAGRREASTRQIAIAGTLAILLQASSRGLLTFPESIERLRAFGFRASPRLVASMLARVDGMSFE